MLRGGYELKCWKCGTEYLLPEPLYVSAKASEKISFFCPYGHEAHFPSKETESRLEAIQRERDRLKQRLAEKDDAILAERMAREEAERVAARAKGQVTRIKKRVSTGVCPCCNRHFTNPESHMASKHKETANV